MYPNAPKHYETHQNMSLGSNGMDRVSSLRKFRRDFVARTFALIAPVRPDLHLVLCINEMVQMHSYHYETHKNMSLGSNGMDRVPLLRKINAEFVARTFALIAPVRPDLH